METKLEGVCVPVTGEEENYLHFFALPPGADRNVGITDLLAMAGIEATAWSHAVAFETPDHKYWREDVAKYRAALGREYPPLYRVRITLHVEPVPDDEAAKLWREEARRVAERQVATAESDEP